MEKLHNKKNVNNTKVTLHFGVMGALYSSTTMIRYTKNHQTKYVIFNLLYTY